MTFVAQGAQHRLLSTNLWALQVEAVEPLPGALGE